MTDYTLSIIFSDMFRVPHVALILKDHPAWQAGKYNALGGKVEPGETPKEAALRELKEEADLVPDFLVPVSPDDMPAVVDIEEAYRIFFYVGWKSNPELLVQKTSERPVWKPIQFLDTPPVLYDIRSMIYSLHKTMYASRSQAADLKTWQSL